MSQCQCLLVICSSSALASSAQEVAHPREIPHHHEYVGLLIPEHITNSL
ncbi:unnamed protein product, partial [Brugia timori]|uniref:Secreted protein n=1 Tax=Brugia timori TaxID=42155 RepID=A0A0R3QQY5_9BILA